MTSTDKKLKSVKEELDRYYILLHRANESGNRQQIRYYVYQIKELEDLYIEIRERT